MFVINTIEVNLQVGIGLQDVLCSHN